MTNPSKEIFVYADFHWFDSPKLLGKLYSGSLKGKEIISFEYDLQWLKERLNFNLDPDLTFFGGLQYTKDEKENFGMIYDSMPDRWGRMLLNKMERLNANSEKRNIRVLTDTDYLLGISDVQRMGGLRFRDNPDANFINDSEEYSAPPFSTLRELENASIMLEEKENLKGNRDKALINLLIAPGSSLGGARPKAGVADEKGDLWIAKFPSKNDEINKGAWEMVVNQLSVIAGINTAPGIIKKFSGKHHTFLTKRFDRADNKKRIHFASSMTMLGYTDHSKNPGYLDFIDFITRHCVKPKNDLNELWKRIVFNISVKNCDDHLRNHGFLLYPEGWKLSPAYDVNPDVYGNQLSLNINENDNSLDYDLVLEVSSHFRVELKDAKKIIESTKKAVSEWSRIAKKYKISKYEIEFMERAFSL